MWRAYSVQDAKLTTYHESIFDPPNNLKKRGHWLITLIYRGVN